jgi:hypothetical protein
MLIAVFLAVAVFSQEPDNSAENTWGGEHIEMVTTASGAQIEFDCATGAINEPVPLKSTSDFQLKGTFTREHGGPVRENEAPRVVSATYSGRIENGKMYLKISVAGKDAYEESFVLRQRQSGRLMKCR